LKGYSKLNLEHKNKALATTFFPFSPSVRQAPVQGRVVAPLRTSIQTQFVSLGHLKRNPVTAEKKTFRKPFVKRAALFIRKNSET
jgi:hypothetical protein